MRIEWEPNGGLYRAAPQRSAARARPPLARRCARSSATRSTIISSPAQRHGRGHRRLPRADRQGADDAALGLWLLAEPPALRDPGRNCSACCANIAAASLPIDNDRPGLVLLARGQLGQPLLRSGALPRPAGDGRRGPPPQRPDHDLGLAEILSDHRQLRELDAIGGIYRRRSSRARRADRPGYIRAKYRDWVGPGYRQRLLRSLQCRRRREHLLAPDPRDAGGQGFDAWWLDSDEPDFHSNLSIEERAAADEPDRARARARPSSTPIRSSMSRASIAT